MGLLLSGCGWHLRGSINLPPELHTFYLDGTSPYSDLIRQIRKTLRNADITVVDNRQQAPVTLYIISDSLTNSQSTIGLSGSIRNYTVTYTITYELRNALGETIIPAKSVSASETVTVLENELINNSSNLQEAKNTLTQNVIPQMMDQISSANTISALKKTINKRKTGTRTPQNSQQLKDYL